ncbi:MAG TPA: carboxypeptidase-like regulatory domain-containing protein, partial [Ferruginibacter sp.]|nr:carboxypeptidase-like regulatory domain-containing protein [Ferruginibacter sp.]
MKRIFLFTLLFGSFSIALAQKAIKGRIYDAGTNAPLAGATISIPGKGAASSDKDGFFTIDCSKSTTIVVSFVGYQTAKYTIRNCGEDFSIGLVSLATNLDEVEITA